MTEFIDDPTVISGTRKVRYFLEVKYLSSDWHSTDMEFDDRIDAVLTAARYTVARVFGDMRVVDRETGAVITTLRD